MGPYRLIRSPARDECGACPATAASHTVRLPASYRAPMSTAMKTQMHRIVLVWLSVGAGMGSLVSCSAVEGGQVGPVENAPGRHRAVAAS
jgi:hypothetical protein